MEVEDVSVIGIALFGALGGIVRFAFADSLVATAVINVVGALAFGFWLRATSESTAHRQHRWLSDGIGLGLIGSATTFSSFIIDGLSLIETRPILAMIYIACTVGGGLGACVLGSWCANATVVHRATGSGQR